MKTYIQKQQKTLEAMVAAERAPDYDAGDDLRQVIRDVELRAHTEGFPGVAQACDIRQGPIAAKVARTILTRCLSLVKDDPTTDWLLVSEVAQILRISDSKVLEFIKSSRLPAKNLSDSDRPQYRIHVDDIKNLDDTTPDKKARRRKSAPAKDYFPEK